MIKFFVKYLFIQILLLTMSFSQENIVDSLGFNELITDIKSFKNDDYNLDTMINLGGEFFIVEGVVSKNGYQIFRGNNEVDVELDYTFFDGYYIFFKDKRKLKIFSDKYLETISKILVLDSLNQIKGTLSFIQNSLIGISEIVKTEQGRKENFILTVSPSWYDIQASILLLFEEGIFNRLIKGNISGSFNEVYQRDMDDDDIYELFWDYF